MRQWLDKRSLIISRIVIDATELSVHSVNVCNDVAMFFRVTSQKRLLACRGSPNPVNNDLEMSSCGTDMESRRTKVKVTALISGSTSFPTFRAISQKLLYYQIWYSW